MSNKIDYTAKYPESFFLHQEGLYFSLGGGSVYFKSPDLVRSGNEEKKDLNKISLKDIQTVLDGNLKSEKQTFKPVLNACLESANRDLNEVRETYYKKTSGYSSFLLYRGSINFVDSLKADNPAKDVLQEALKNHLIKLGVNLPNGWKIEDLKNTPNIELPMWNSIFTLIIDTQINQGMGYKTPITEKDRAEEEVFFNKINNILSKEFPELDSIDPKQRPYYYWRAIEYMGAQSDTYDPAKHGDFDQYLEGVYREGLKKTYQTTYDRLQEIQSLSQNSNMQKARDFLNQSIEGSPEAHYLLGKNTLYAIDVSDEHSLARGGEFFDLADSPNREQIHGSADNDRNLICLDLWPSKNAEHHLDTFREEVGHMVDYYIMEEYGEDDVPFSNKVVPDAFNDITDPESDLSKLENGALLRNMSWFSNKTLETLQNTIKTQGDFKIGADSYHALQFIIESLKDVLKLDDYENHIKNSEDGELGNPSRDSEVMVKFHCLRMLLEDRIAKHSNAEPDHYGYNTSVLQLLELTSSELCRAYKQQWLPALNITIGVKNDELRTAFLKAHIAKQGEEAGIVTQDELDALKNLDNDKELKINDLPGTENDSIQIGSHLMPIDIKP